MNTTIPNQQVLKRAANPGSRYLVVYRDDPDHGAVQELVATGHLEIVNTLEDRDLIQLTGRGANAIVDPGLDESER